MLLRKQRGKNCRAIFAALLPHTVSCDVLQPRQTGIKKHPVRLAEIIFPRTLPGLFPMPAASAPAYHKVTARFAFLRMIVEASTKPLSRRRL